MNAIVDLRVLSVCPEAYCAHPVMRVIPFGKRTSAY